METIPFGFDKRIVEVRKELFSWSMSIRQDEFPPGVFLVFLLLYLPVVIQFGAVQEEEIMLLLSIEERFRVNMSFIEQFYRSFID